MKVAQWRVANTAKQTYPLVGSVTSGAGVSNPKHTYFNLITNDDSRNVWTIPNTDTILNTATASYLEYEITLTDTIRFDRFVLHGYAANNVIFKSKNELRWSVDNFTTNLGSFIALPSGYTRTSVDLYGTPLIQPGVIKFRVYFYAAKPLLQGGITYFPTQFLVQGNNNYNTSDNTPSFYGANDGNSTSVSIWKQNNTCASSTPLSKRICQNQLPHTWNGVTFTSFGTKTAHFINRSGCDSAVVMTLSIAKPSVGIATSADGYYPCAGQVKRFASIVDTLGIATGTTLTQWYKNDTLVGTGKFFSFAPYSLKVNDSIYFKSTLSNYCGSEEVLNSVAIKILGLKEGPEIGVSSITSVCNLGGTGFIKNTNTAGGGYWESSDLSVATVNAPSGGNGTFTNVGVGTTTLTYTKIGKNDCPSIASVILTVLPVPTITSTINSVCKNSLATLTASHAGGTWTSINNRCTINPTIGVVTGVNAGQGSIRYALTNAAGCSSTSSNLILIVLPQPAQPSISFEVGNTVNPLSGAVPSTAYCNNRTFTLAGNPVGGSWSSSNTAVITVNNAGVVSTVGMGTGSVIYTVTTNGCSNSRSIVGNIVGCAARGMNGIENGKLKMENEFTMYPNPAHSFIRLNVNSLMGAGSIVVTDLYGKQIKRQSLSMGTNTIDVSKLSKGIYFVSMITNEGKTTKKLVVE